MGKSRTFQRSTLPFTSGKMAIPSTKLLRSLEWQKPPRKFVIDLIASGLGGKEEHSRLLTELEIPDAAFEEVEEKLTQSRTTLQHIFEETSLGRYNEIRAIIAVMINGFEL